MIFDTNIHPTINEKWDNKIPFNPLSKIIKIKKKFKLKGYFAVGINNIGEYEHKKFFLKTSSLRNAYPVAGLNLKKNIIEEIKKIRNIGFKFVKIHNRSNSIPFEKVDLEKIFYHCNKYNLKILICSYFNSYSGLMPEKDPKYLLTKMLNKFKNLKILIIHGGCERLLEFAELSRFYENLLLDLSLTITKYEGSSIDSDIKYLFKNFDKKITLGSDYPEIDYKYFIKRINFFSKGISNSKKENIFFKNALKFINS